MKQFGRVLLAVLLAAAGWVIWAWLHPSPEKAIRKQLAKLEENLESKPGEGNFKRVAAVNRAVSFFTTDVVINGEGMSQVNETINGRTELQQAIFAARSRLEGEIWFNDIHIQLGPEQTNAVVTFSAVARLSGQNEPYAQDIKAQFQKIDGLWLIARVDPIALKSAPPQ